MKIAINIHNSRSKFTKHIGSVRIVVFALATYTDIRFPNFLPMSRLKARRALFIELERGLGYRHQPRNPNPRVPSLEPNTASARDPS
jgi:hypothetical protein